MQGLPLNSSSTHLSPYTTPNSALVPPPPAPHGPRSPAQIMPSRTPSPERFVSVQAPLSSSGHHSRTDSSTSSRDYYAANNGLEKLKIGDRSAIADDDDEATTPIKPSAKALGKRKVVEVQEPDRKFPQCLPASHLAQQLIQARLMQTISSMTVMNHTKRKLD